MFVTVPTSTSSTDVGAGGESPDESLRRGTEERLVPEASKEGGASPMRAVSEKMRELRGIKSLLGLIARRGRS